MKKMQSALKSKKGFVTATVAAMMVALVGMAALATDVGVMYINHSQLENMTDAGALAGAQEYFFNQSQVESVAESYALQNGKTGDFVHAWVDTDDMKVFVTANRNVSLYLARVLQKNNANISTTSAAKIMAVSGTSNACPFGITWDSAFLPEGSAAGSTFTLKVDEKDEFKGNFHTLRLQSRSGGTS
ncbi:MAG: pilus assembly protein TadG-related protein, partial [Acidaminococcaceae bacterium]